MCVIFVCMRVYYSKHRTMKIFTFAVLCTACSEQCLRKVVEIAKSALVSCREMVFTFVTLRGVVYYSLEILQADVQ